MKHLLYSFCLMNISLVLSFNVAAEPAKRIIALSPHSVEMLYAIGAGDKIVATTEHADYPQAANKIARIGGYNGIQIERVIELEPDLVIVWESGNKAEDIAKLKQLGFNLYSSDPLTLDAVADELVALGEYIGHAERAKLAANDYRKQLQRLRQSNLKKTAISVFYQLWSTPLMTVSKHSWIQQVISVCNGRNVFADAQSDYPQVSIENVLIRQPEVILQSQDKGNVMGIDWAQWPEIPAVQHQQIYQLNADLLHRAGPRALVGVASLCQALDQARANTASE